MTKEYPLEVKILNEFEGGFLGYYSKGHHDPHVFIDAIKDFADGTIESVGHVRHEYWRCLPVGPGYKGVVLLNAKSHARGAFPVTVVE